MYTGARRVYTSARRGIDKKSEFPYYIRKDEKARNERVACEGVAERELPPAESSPYKRAGEVHSGADPVKGQ